MSKEMVISTSPHETKVALVEEGQVVEVYVEREKEFGLVGSIYKGRVTRVLPGMQSAFVDIGLDRDAFLYVSDFFEDLEEYEREASPTEVEEPSTEAEEPPAEAEAPPAAEPGEARAQAAAPEAEAPAPSEPAPEPQPVYGEPVPGESVHGEPVHAEPVQGEPVEEERQPDFVHHEPPLRLPEQRPLGRGPQGGRRRHRGGRGRHRGGRGPMDRGPMNRGMAPGMDRGPMDRSPMNRGPMDRGPMNRGPMDRGPMNRGPMDRGPMNRGPMDRGMAPGMARGPRAPYSRPREPQYRPPPEGFEPIILPGESLAKYRDRPARPPAEPPIPSEPRRGEVVAEAVGPDAPLPLTPAHEEIREAEIHEEFRAPATAEPAPEPTTRGESFAEPEAPPEHEAEGPAMSESESEPAATESTEAYPEASTLAEIQRAPQEDKVSLPPSVRDRTAGGVEWERGRGRGRGGRGRGRFGRPRGGRGRGPARPGREERARPTGRGPRMHARPSRGQPAISELLRAGQEIIVQIAKEQMGKKGARITSHVSLPGRYLVFMPTIEHVGVSRKIGTAEERARLRRVLLELKGTISGGFVVRTAASGCTDEDLRQDIDYLVKLWHDVRVRSEERSSPALLHHDLSLVERLLRDHFTQEYESVWIDNEEEYAKVVEFVAHFQPALTNRVKLYTKDAPIFDEMGVQREIDRALQPKVWLKSGGYIVINHTEALVAIDVNTGKYVGKGSTRLEDTIVKTNLDAIKEIVRQIRLRDLGGIIIIDFIDMEDRRNRHRVMAALEDALRVDRSPSKVLGFNEFGLIAITRKRSRLSLERLLCQPCPTCDGIGMVKSIPTLCYEIQNEARKMAHTIDAPELTIRANPEIIKALKVHESELVHELEEQTGKNIILQPDVTLHFEQYNIY